MNPVNKKPNQLIKEKSPYLLQHANNPVDWFPWCEAAFVKAKKDDKPILLSVGYSTCHWCHVMERESFENEKIANYLNQYFVSIKVDREERPDIDKIYMDALHAMDQQGGWPLNMFLTPDKMPIAGGTYFPPEPMYGRKSFLEILHIINNSWATRREEISRAGENLLKFLISLNNSEGEGVIPNLNCFTLGFKTFEKYYDPNFYGFKTNPQNKFPPSMGLSFLLNYFSHFKDFKALEMVESTLVAMKKGGIYDQIGGGICRYSTDHRWLVPHFEKMLYDNSLFLLMLVECFSLTKKQIYKQYAYDIIQYIHRDMTLENGGIASAEDADSEGEEGKFYVWDYSQLKDILEEDSDLLLSFWNVTKEGNFENKKNILNESFENNSSDNEKIYDENWNQKLSRIRNKLLIERNKRVRPLKDDKVLTSWNSLYVRALALAGRIFDDLELIESAEKTYNYLNSTLIREGRVLRRWRENQASINGYLVDYAELAHAALELYRSTFNPSYLAQADKLAKDVIRLFSNDKGAYFDTGIDAEVLIKRSIDSYDSVEPSGNTTISFVFQKLALYGYSFSSYMKKTEEIFTYFQRDLETRPLSSSYMLSSYLLYIKEKKEIIFLFQVEDDFCTYIKSKIQTSYAPEVSFYYANENQFKKNKTEIPFLYGKEVTEPYVLYICKKGICETPIFDREEIISALIHHLPSCGF
jgi:uncharacterized protein